MAAVDVIGAACEIGVRDFEPPLAEPDPGPPPPLLLGDTVLDSGVDEKILRPKYS